MIYSFVSDEFFDTPNSNKPCKETSVLVMHPYLQNAKRIVFKLGTRIVLNEHGEVAKTRLSHIASVCAQLVSQGKAVLVVSSGAVGLGRKELCLDLPVLSLNEKQACAAVGQNQLMNLYRQLFQTHGLTTAQLLLTASDFSERKRYLNLKATMETLLAHHVVPIINENDTVSTTELAEDKGKSFGDNDKLSALVASKLGADLLIILTNVNGLYTGNPETHPDAVHIPMVEGFASLRDIDLSGKSSQGRGGMVTKIEAAKIAALSGVDTYIANGLSDHPLAHLLSETAEENTCSSGTWVLAQNPIPGRKRWLGWASGYHGAVIVNAGARLALMHQQASLLPVGVVATTDQFQANQVVSIQDETGEEIGRGLVNFSDQALQKIMGKQSSEIFAILEDAASEVVIHRDNLVIFQEYQ